MCLEELETQTPCCILCNASAKEIRKPHEEMKKKERGYREDSGIIYSVQLYNSG